MLVVSAQQAVDARELKFINRSSRYAGAVFFIFTFGHLLITQLMEKLVFATNNAHKLEEIIAILGSKLSILSLSDIGYSEEIPEPFDTLEANALHKARVVHSFCQLPVFADDTGLEVEALGGRPGVLSARYAGEQKDSRANMQKVIRELQGTTNRNARFRTVIAFVDGVEEKCFEGIVNGALLTEENGNGGFGYDPIFVPDGYTQTFAQMPAECKNNISHRGRAIEKFMAYLLLQTQ